MPWSLHTAEPTTPSGLEAALHKARDQRLRADERTRILEGLDTDAAAVAHLTGHMDRAIQAALDLVTTTKTYEQAIVHVSISGDDGVEGLLERTNISMDVVDPKSMPQTSQP